MSVFYYSIAWQLLRSLAQVHAVGKSDLNVRTVRTSHHGEKSQCWLPGSSIIMQNSDRFEEPSDHTRALSGSTKFKDKSRDCNNTTNIPDFQIPLEMITSHLFSS
jgi:hypothetical protein